MAEFETGDGGGECLIKPEYLIYALQQAHPIILPSPFISTISEAEYIRLPSSYQRKAEKTNWRKVGSKENRLKKARVCE